MTYFRHLKSALIVLFMISFSASYGQFAILRDPEGYINVRNEPAGKKVADTLGSGRIVYFLEGKDNWCEVEYEKGENTATGFVHASRMKMIDTYSTVKKAVVTENQVVFSSPGIQVSVSIAPFIKGQHKLTYDRKNSNSPYLDKIDGSMILGVDGGLPRTQYKTINITMNGKNILIPSSAIKNLFEPNFGQTEVHYDTVNNILYIAAMNSDGAGGYAILWVIENGRYRERATFYGF